jgi:hypothetical protein
VSRLSLHSLSHRLVDVADSCSGHCRARRWTWLLNSFPDLAEMSVIDIGGTVESWHPAPVRPKHVHVVNLVPHAAEAPPWAEVDCADVCALPDRIANRRYDAVFSNSVIEHVGGHERRLRFAEAVHNLSDLHWVQTPYRHFPIEPHWIAPGMQYLPLILRTRVAQHWPLTRIPVMSRESALDAVLWVELLDRTQMRHYFPNSTLRAERIAGLTKSLIAIKAQ